MSSRVSRGSERRTIWLRADIHDRLKKHCTSLGKRMEGAVDEAVDMWLYRQRNPIPSDVIREHNWKWKS